MHVLSVAAEDKELHGSRAASLAKLAGVLNWQSGCEVLVDASLSEEQPRSFKKATYPHSSKDL